MFAFLDTHLSQPTKFAIAAPIVYFGGLAIGRWLKRRHGFPFGAAYQLFLVAVALVLLMSSTIYAHYLLTIAGVLGILVGLAVFRRLFWEKWFQRHYGTEAPKLLQQVFSFGVFCAGTLGLGSMRHDWQVSVFLTGSGIVAVVLGFAMQETLANIVSGIALQIGKPFKTGDWLIVTDIRAEVVEVNWRSTRLRTTDDVYLDIPNKTIVTSTITNLSFPTKAHSNRMRVGFDYSTPPNVVRDVLRSAAEAAQWVLAEPPVKVFLKDFADSSIIYEIKYSLEDDHRFNDIEDAIRTNIWYAAKRAGLDIPFPQRVVHINREKSSSSKNVGDFRELTRKLELFAPLSESQRERLIENAHILRFGRGERIIKQGNEGCSMFVILSGELDVLVGKEGSETHVASLHAGEAFGEMCMLTGEARTATIRAKADSLVWEIRRAEMQPLLQENTELATRLSELLARRKTHTDGVIAAQATSSVVIETATQEYASSVLRKIRSLFGNLNAPPAATAARPAPSQPGA